MEVNGKKICIFVLAVLAVSGLLYWGHGEGWFTGEGSAQVIVHQVLNQETGLSQDTVTLPADTEVEVITTGAALPIETLKIVAKNKYTMAAITTGANVSFYEPGADVSDPNVEYLEILTPATSGVASSTNMIIQTNTPYDVYLNGISTYYDEKIAFKINYNRDTGKGFVMMDGKSYVPVVAFGTFVDPDTLPETQTGWLDNGTRQIYYNDTALGGSGWFRMDMGNNDANKEIQNMVVCFRDSDGDMDGDELTGLTASYVSGNTKISLPGALLGYWKEAMGGGAESCINVASALGSSEKARWEFTLTVDETNWVDTEEFEMIQDDLGNYKKRQYPSSNVKATAQSLTVGSINN